MAGAKKGLQVSMRLLLLRGPANAAGALPQRHTKGTPEKAGVLLRQRCTSRLRRWTRRLQQSSPVAWSPEISVESTARGMVDPPSRNAFDSSSGHEAELACHDTSSAYVFNDGGWRTEDGGGGHVIVSRGTEEVVPAASCHEVEDLSPLKGTPHVRHRHVSAGWHLQSGASAAFETRQSGAGHGLLGSLSWQGRSAWSSPAPSWSTRLGAPGWALAGVRSQTLSSSSSSPSSVKAEEEKEGGGGPEQLPDTIEVTFVNRDGSEKVIHVPLGTHMLQAAHDNDIDLEGACEASLACSTCHVVFEDEGMYEKVPPPTDEENDMLDLAFGLTPTSRLGCQVLANKDLNGVRLRIPAATRNFAVDGFVPKPH